MVDVHSLSTHREISHQPKMWRETYNYILDKREEVLSFYSTYYTDHVTIIFTGAGTSSFIGNILSFIIPKYNKHNFKSIPTTDIITHPEAVFNKNKKYILISFARSGNSPESIATVDLANAICENNIAHIIITCNADGELAKLAKTAKSKNMLLLVLPPETNDRGLAMTSSFTSMLLTALLILDIDHIETKRSDIEKASEKAQSVLDKYAGKIKEMVNYGFERAVFLGSGEKKGIAEECHLKLQELTDGRVICLFDSFLGFRHGPKAVLNEKTLLVYLFSDDETIFNYEKDLVIQINRQIKPMAQIYVAQHRHHIANVEFEMEIIPEVQGETAYDVLFYVFIGQLIGMYKSIELGLNPDNPSTSDKITRVVEGVTIY